MSEDDIRFYILALSFIEVDINFQHHKSNGQYIFYPLLTLSHQKVEISQFTKEAEKLL